MLARLLDEQRAVLKDPNTPLTWEHLGEMDLLHDCMRETLRMYPPLVRLVLNLFLFRASDRSSGGFRIFLDTIGPRVRLGGGYPLLTTFFAVVQCHPRERGTPS